MAWPRASRSATYRSAPLGSSRRSASTNARSRSFSASLLLPCARPQGSATDKQATSVAPTTIVRLRVLAVLRLFSKLSSPLPIEDEQQPEDGQRGAPDPAGPAARDRRQPELEPARPACQQAH